MKKAILCLALMFMGGVQAFCEAPEGWETMYFHHGEKEYCSAELTGDISAQFEFYGNALVISYEAPAKIKGDITLSVGDLTVKGEQDKYNTVTFVIKDSTGAQLLIDAIGDGSKPIVLSLGNDKKTVKLPEQAAKSLNQAHKWIKGLSNAMKYE